MFTTEFDRFVRPARPRAQLWRLIVGLIVTSFVYISGLAAVFFLIWTMAGREGVRLWVGKLTEASTPTGTMLLFASFIGMAIGPMVAAKFVHKRRAMSLFGAKKVLLRDFLISSGTVLALYTVISFIWSFFYDVVPNLDPLLWLTFLPIALLGVCVQTGAEELVFRGYLMQQLGARFRSPFFWMILPSVAFGLIHFDPARAGENAWLIVAAATAFGLVAADLTRLTGSIGAAWGFHFANNVLAILVIAVDGTLPGLALYLTPYSAADTSQVHALIVADFTGLVLAWMLLRRVLQR